MISPQHLRPELCISIRCSRHWFHFICLHLPAAKHFLSGSIRDGVRGYRIQLVQSNSLLLLQCLRLWEVDLHRREMSWKAPPGHHPKDRLRRRGGRGRWWIWLRGGVGAGGRPWCSGHKLVLRLWKVAFKIRPEQSHITQIPQCGPLSPLVPWSL